MTGRKRPLSPDVSLDTSTDALCRAVKRLNTNSSRSMSPFSLKEERLAGNEGAPRDDQEASSTLSGAESPGTRKRPGPLEAQPLPLQDKRHSHRAEPAIPAAPRLQAKDLRGITHASTAPASFAGLSVNVERLKHRLANAALGGEDSSEDGDAVAQPGTPSRVEACSPAASKGYRLGTLESDPPKSDNYALLYEEANMMLKNLHFARLQRHAQVP